MKKYYLHSEEYNLHWDWIGCVDMNSSLFEHWKHNFARELHWWSVSVLQWTAAHRLKGNMQMCGLHQKCSFAPIFVCSNMTAAHFHIGFLKETYKGRLGHSSPIPPCQFGGHRQQPVQHQHRQQPEHIVFLLHLFSPQLWIIQRIIHHQQPDHIVLIPNDHEPV